MAELPVQPLREQSVYERVRTDECAAFSGYYEGDLNALFCVVANEKPGEAERAAIQASAARGGFPASSIIWITIAGSSKASFVGEEGDGTTAPVASGEGELFLDGADLLRLVETVDPLCLVVLDQQAAEVVSRAYNQPIKLECCDSLLCRPYCAFAHFARMLETDDRKQRAWGLLKELLARTNELQ